MAYVLDSEDILLRLKRKFPSASHRQARQSKYMTWLEARVAVLKADEEAAKAKARAAEAAAEAAMQAIQQATGAGDGGEAAAADGTEAGAGAGRDVNVPDVSPLMAGVAGVAGLGVDAAVYGQGLGRLGEGAVVEQGPTAMAVDGQ